MVSCSATALIVYNTSSIVDELKFETKGEKRNSKDPPVLGKMQHQK